MSEGGREIHETKARDAAKRRWRQKKEKGEKRVLGRMTVKRKGGKQNKGELKLKLKFK